MPLLNGIHVNIFYVTNCYISLLKMFHFVFYARRIIPVSFYIGKYYFGDFNASNVWASQIDFSKTVIISWFWIYKWSSNCGLMLLSFRYTLAEFIKGHVVSDGPVPHIIIVPSRNVCVHVTCCEMLRTHKSVSLCYVIYVCHWCYYCFTECVDTLTRYIAVMGKKRWFMYDIGHTHCV